MSGLLQGPQKELEASCPRLLQGLRTCKAPTAMAMASRKDPQGCGTACAQLAQSGHIPPSLLSRDAFAGTRESPNRAEGVARTGHVGLGGT